jgi:hypothetical protein
MRCSRFWAIVFLLTLVLVVPAPAQDEPKPPSSIAVMPSCIPVKIVLDAVGAVQHVELDEEQTKRVIKWYNDLPPVSDEKWDYVVMFQTTAGLGLLFGNNKLVCDGMKVRRDQVPSLLDAIAGGEGA